MSPAAKRKSNHGYDVFNRNCPSRRVLDHVAGRWGILALVALLDKPMRFGELRRRVDGVSDKMLSQAMQALERDGLVIRDQKSDIPPVVEYSITDSGRSVGKAADAFLEALMNNMDQVRAAQNKFDTELKNPEP